MNTTDEKFREELLIAIETELLTWQDYQPWVDRQIEDLNQPPLWMLELSTAKTVSSAGKIIRSSFQNNILPYSWNFKDFYAACIYIRHVLEETPWTEFLLGAGVCADGIDGSFDPSEYYTMLDMYNRSKMKEDILEKQKNEVISSLCDSIKKVETLYNYITKKTISIPCVPKM